MRGAAIRPGVCLATLGVVLCAALAVCSGVALGAPGDPDRGFGTDGIVTPTFCGLTAVVIAGPPRPTETIVAPDGDIYVAGQCTDGIFVARFLPDGTLDTSYGSDGEWTGNFGTGQAPLTGDAPASQDPPVRLALTPSGELIIATYANDANENPQIAVAELTRSGALDPGFASGGVLIQQLSQQPLPDSDVYELDWGSRPFAVAVQPDGRILIAGYADTSDSVAQVLVERLTAAGEPDPSFGVDGIYEHQYGLNPDAPDLAFSAAEAMLVQPNGDIVLGISAAAACNAPSQFAIARLTSNGEPDPSFTPTYVQSWPVRPELPGAPAVPLAIAEASNGNYLLAGYATDPNAAGLPTELMAVAQFTPEGPLDSSFAGDGLWESEAAPAEASAIAVASNGDIVLTSGASEGPAGPDWSMQDLQYVVRLTPSGNGDSSFGISGIRSYDLAAAPDPGIIPQTDATDGVMTPNGELITVGTATDRYVNVFSYIQKLDLNGTPAASTPPPTPAPPPPAGSSTTLGSAPSSTSTPPPTATGLLTPTEKSTNTPANTPTKPVSRQVTPWVLALTANSSIKLRVRCSSTVCHLTAVVTAVEHLRGSALISVSATRPRATTKSRLRLSTVRLGEAHTTLKPGARRIWTIRLNAAGSKLLRREKRLAALLTVNTTGAHAPSLSRVQTSPR